MKDKKQEEDQEDDEEEEDKKDECDEKEKEGGRQEGRGRREGGVEVAFTARQIKKKYEPERKAPIKQDSAVRVGNLRPIKGDEWQAIRSQIRIQRRILSPPRALPLMASLRTPPTTRSGRRRRCR